MTKTALYERLLYKLHNKNKAVSVPIPVWEEFWSYVTLSFHVTQSFRFFHYFHLFILLSVLISATVYILALHAVFV